MMRSATPLLLLLTCSPAAPYRLPSVCRASSLRRCRGVLLAATDAEGALRLQAFKPPRRTPAPTTTDAPSNSEVAPCSFEQRCEMLRKLVALHGSADTSLAEPSLTRWAVRQRRLRRLGALADERVERLDELGFVWDPRGARWEARLEELAAYADEHGHCSVTASQDPVLAGWCGRQRRKHREGGLALAQVAALRELEFEFDPLQAAWEERLQQLAAALASGSPPPLAIRRWAARQRRAKKDGSLSPERVEALEELPGFRWGVLPGRRPSLREPACPSCSCAGD